MRFLSAILVLVGLMIHPNIFSIVAFVFILGIYIFFNWNIFKYSDTKLYNDIISTDEINYKSFYNLDVRVNSESFFMISKENNIISKYNISGGGYSSMNIPIWWKKSNTAIKYLYDNYPSIYFSDPMNRKINIVEFRRAVQLELLK